MLSPFEKELLQRREEMGLTELHAKQGNGLIGWADVPMDNEISIELAPNELLIRHSRIFHATWENKTPSSRLMNHFGFQPAYRDNHRIRFEEVLTPRCLEALTPEQRQVLWIGREFAIAPQYIEEQARERGVVQFGTLEELPELARRRRDRFAAAASRL